MLIKIITFNLLGKQPCTFEREMMHSRWEFREVRDVVPNTRLSQELVCSIKVNHKRKAVTYQELEAILVLAPTRKPGLNIFHLDSQFRELSQ